jgi:superfamily II DNA/RNA helicase
LYYVDTEQFDVDTIESPASLDLTHLKWLVVDEADRLMHDSRFDWLTEIERAVYESGWPLVSYRIICTISRLGVTYVGSRVRDRSTDPLRKILLSATLSHDPELLAQFRLHVPRLVRTVTHKQLATPAAVVDGDDAQNVMQLSLPPTLHHAYVTCVPAMKPLIVYCLLHAHAHDWTSVLVFTNSRCVLVSVRLSTVCCRDDADRLCKLLRILLATTHADWRIESCTGELFANHRRKIIRRFATGQVFAACSCVRAQTCVESRYDRVGFGRARHGHDIDFGCCKLYAAC